MPQPIKLFVKDFIPEKALRGEMIDLLKPFFGKKASFTDEERIFTYAISKEDFIFSDTMDEADFCVLPYSWNYYLLNGKKREALDFIEQAGAKNIKVITWTSGDFGVKIPELKNIVVFRTSGYRSKLPDYHLGMPVFIRDPLMAHYGKDRPDIRDKADKPVIGFCGYSKTTMKKNILHSLTTLKKNIGFILSVNPHDPQSLYPPTLRRSRILHRVEQDPALEANFIKRDKYRAGVSDGAQKKKTTLEFFDNIAGSDYIIGVRGAGNFSVRLYETMAMGRIPVFINTDCLLPLEDIIPWEQHMVIVEEKDLGLLGEKILEFHNKFNLKEFRELQEKNREIWEKYLRLGPFWKTALSRLSSN